jgi:hypothetical protein
MEWTRRLMALSAIATVVIYAYLFYGLLAGDVGNWSQLNPADRQRIGLNIDAAIRYLNASLGLLLLTICILFYDEEMAGYSLVAGAVAIYYGLPFALDAMFGSQLQTWETTGNKAALAIFSQLKILALMMAIPGAILAIRDIVMRLIDGGSRSRDDFSAKAQSVQKSEPEPGGALLGVFAKCYQLPFCRPVIRRNCPIYHARTKCWKERVGCMCEEKVIRHAMDMIIGKEIITFEKEKDLNAAPPEPAIGGLIQMDDSFIRAGQAAPAASAPVAEEKPVEVKAAAPPPNRRDVKIPHNPNLPHAVKVERCRNCVIYMEHQRRKYQLVAPAFVAGVPLFAYFNLDKIVGLLNSLLSNVDQAMNKLSLVQKSSSTIATNLFSGAGAAQYIVIGCLVVILTTMVLRGVEYVVFKLKI